MSLTKEDDVMGILESLTEAGGSLMGKSGGSGIEGQLLQAVTQLLGKGSNIGGLAGLVQLFQKNGLGEIVNSWVSTGKNLPISADQIKQGLGSGLVEQLAGKAGLSADAASHQLVNLLPNVVDKLTPGGTIPDSNLLDQGLNLLRGKLGG
jgi:uncharacterized protein YidB (DUF937 family)